MKKLIHTACGTALLAFVGLAQAGTVTFNSWAYGNGNAVNVSAASSGVSFNGQAGAFTVTLSKFAGPDSGFNGVFEAFCVELEENMSIGGRYANYKLVAASDYFQAKGKPSVAADLTSLISYAETTSLLSGAAAGFQDDQSTALQLAIWNAVYDIDNTLAGTSSARLSDSSRFSTSPAGNFMNASSLLANAGSAGSAGGYSLYVLQSPSQQDQVIWLRNSVPEPTSLALVALALGGAGFVSRRRSR